MTGLPQASQLSIFSFSLICSLTGLMSVQAVGGSDIIIFKLRLRL